VRQSPRNHGQAVGTDRAQPNQSLQQVNKMLKTTKIATLLAWGFGLVIALIAGMTVIVFLKSDSVGKNASMMADDINPKVSAAADIRLNIMRNWSNSLLLTGITDSAEIKRITAEMAEINRVSDEKYAFLKKSVASETGKKLLESTLQARQEYAGSRRKFIEMLKTGGREEANQYLLVTVRSNLYKYTDEMGRFFDYQSNKMVSINNASVSQTSLLKTTTLIIAFFVVLISVLAAYVVSKSIQSILGGDAHYANKVAKEIANGNLGVEVTAQADDTSSLLYSMKTMRDKLRAMVMSIQDSAEQVGQSAEQLAQTSGAVAAASAQQSAATSATAAAVEEMTVGIESISTSAHSAKLFSQEASDLSQKGSEVIHSTAAEMLKIASSVESSSAIIAGLEEQSNEISKIVGVIKDIADQTNLLALNAAIEAARAGEQGRGFAVVADEVRKLAERTSRSTQEVGLTMEKIQSGTKCAVESMMTGGSQVKTGTTLAKQAGESIREIQTGAESVAGVISDISNALQEQTKASSEIARNVENIAQMVEENNNSSAQAAIAAGELQKLAQALAASVKSFRV
jgi:methyl-accepting chemotaxis protein